MPIRERTLPDYARLVSDLVHDFRTPLGSIVGAASALDDYADGIDTATRSRLCAGIIDEARRLDHLLTSLAAIAKARTGTLIREEKRVELNELLRGLASKVRERHSRPVRISVQPQDIFLTGDPAVLQTLLFAMLDLAGLYAPGEDGVELSLSGDGDAAAILQVTSGVSSERVARLSSLLDGQTCQEGEEESRVPADTVFLAAIQEVVHILGGTLVIQHNDEMACLHQTVRLPIQ